MLNDLARKKDCLFARHVKSEAKSKHYREKDSIVRNKAEITNKEGGINLLHK
jgi:hypothetical protein